VRWDPVRRLPVPLGVSAANEFAKVGTPICEMTRGATAMMMMRGSGEVVLLDGAG
jgi:hypothetical protein